MGECGPLKCSRHKTFGLRHPKGNWRNDHWLAVRASEDKTSDAFGKCNLSVSACIPTCRIPSCRQYDRQFFVEATPITSSTTILCFHDSEWLRPRIFFYGFLSKQTDVMFSPSPLRRGPGKPKYQEKISPYKVESQQTQPTFDAESGDRTRAILVGGECSHYCAFLAPPSCTELYSLFLMFAGRNCNGLILHQTGSIQTADGKFKVIVVTIMGLIRAAVTLAIDDRFHIPSLELKCLGKSFGSQRQKLSIPRDSTWPPCD